MNFNTGEELLKLCQQHQKSISKIMMETEAENFDLSPEEISAKMKESFAVMKRAVNKSLTEDIRSMGGLIGGEAKKLSAQRRAGKNICGVSVSKAVTYAMGVLEVNASMGLVVAAPTAGSCGILPGVLTMMQEEYHFTDEEMEEALFNAAAIGIIIVKNATVSGAEGGCQAETGAAAAMAASAVCELMGGSAEECLTAASIALKNIMGLVCDPIAGLVEAPCQKRNAIGAANALISAEIALAGIPSLIPFDETVSAMYRVGKMLPSELRETALGGIADTPTGCRLCKKIFQ